MESSCSPGQLDGCVRLWDYVGGTCVKTYQGHVNRQYGLGGCMGTYTTGGREAFVVSGSEDGDVVAWDVTSKDILWRGKGAQESCARSGFPPRRRWQGPARQRRTGQGYQGLGGES